MTIYRVTNYAGPVEMLLAEEYPPFSQVNYDLVFAAYFFDSRPLSAPGVRERAREWLDACKAAIN